MLALIGQEGERMTALRQNSPFAGVLEPAERWAIYARFESAGKAGAEPVNDSSGAFGNAPSTARLPITTISSSPANAAEAGITCSSCARVIGSLLMSQEADVFPMNHPEKGELIDGSIGEGPPFQRSFGYYAHGVDDSTAVLPRGWRDRLIPVTGESTRGARGWCLEVHDPAIAKYIAGREKDLNYTRALAQYGMTKRDRNASHLCDLSVMRRVSQGVLYETRRGGKARPHFTACRV